jgi:hypothetical protein
MDVCAPQTEHHDHVWMCGALYSSLHDRVSCARGGGEISHGGINSCARVASHRTHRPPRCPRETCPGRFHPHFRDQNRRGIGKSQSMWTDSKMETAGSQPEPDRSAGLRHARHPCGICMRSRFTISGRAARVSTVRSPYDTLERTVLPALSYYSGEPSPDHGR